MNTCEYFETSLSCLIDGELDPTELAPTIDHLAQCAGCRAFYRDARALDQLALDATATRAAAPPSGEIWSRIADRGALRPASSLRRRISRPAWAAVAASALLISVGLWAFPWVLSGRVTPRPAAPPVIVLGDGEDRMSDERFVELATEVLRANPRYHQRMRQVMELVTAPTSESEGSREPRFGDRREPTRGEGHELAVEASMLRGQS